MKYVVQIFRPVAPGSNVGEWHNTAWGKGGDLEKAKKTLQAVASGNKFGFTRARLLEVLDEVVCENVRQPNKRKMCS